MAGEVTSVTTGPSATEEQDLKQTQEETAHTTQVTEGAESTQESQDDEQTAKAELLEQLSKEEMVRPP